MSENYNMSMRKFLKQVGVTSQQEIEKALRDAPEGSGPFAVRATITIEELGLTHTVDGTLKAEAAE